jgi:hypothetical protein
MVDIEGVGGECRGVVKSSLSSLSDSKVVGTANGDFRKLTITRGGWWCPGVVVRVI